MDFLSKTLTGLFLVAALSGCDDDGGTQMGGPLLDASLSGAPGLGNAAPGTTPEGTLDGGASPAQPELYVVSTSISAGDQGTLLVLWGNALSNEALDPQKGLKFSGYGEVDVMGDYVYITEDEPKTITRYSFVNGALVKGPSVSFAGRGVDYLGTDIISPERALVANAPAMKLIEWNPTTMTITSEHDLSALKKPGWGHEYRDGFYRKDDGKFFFYWAYTNDRKTFLNEFTAGVFDTKTNTLKVIHDPSTPMTAGFGGWLDEQGDLYMFADNFGLFTKFGGYPNPKEAALLRVKKGEDQLDPTYKKLLAPTLSGREPWGLYYAGDGLAYTTAIDPSIINNYGSVFELIFAPVHKGYIVDLKNDSAKEIPNVPLTGMGFESFNVNGRLLVPRTSGKVKVFDIEASQCTVYEISKDATATPLFSLPGSVYDIHKLR